MEDLIGGLDLVESSSSTDEKRLPSLYFTQLSSVMAMKFQITLNLNTGRYSLWWIYDQRQERKNGKAMKKVK